MRRPELALCCELHPERGVRMEEQRGQHDGAVYDRALLLSPEKRHQSMELWEVQRYGLDSYGDADYVHLYGMPPTEWYQRGVRLLARTTVECVRDALADLIGTDVARVLAAIGFDGPPQPRGNQMAPFNPELLHIQRKRAPFWRKTS